MAKLEDMDIFDSEIQKCPYDMYRLMREEQPVYNLPGTNIYVVSRYKDLQAAIRRIDDFTIDFDPVAILPGGKNMDLENRIQEEGWPRIRCLSTEGASHKRYRSLVDVAFFPKRVRRLKPYIEAMCHELIDGFIEKGSCDLVEDFSVPLPMNVIADQLGTSREDVPKLKQWSDSSVEPLGLMTSYERDMEIAEEMIEMQHYFVRIFEEKRKNPGDDMITDLVTAEEDGEGLTTTELLSVTNQILVGGNETTTNSITSGILLLLRHPEALEQLRAEPEKYMRTFVEEVIRLETPVQGLSRLAVRDTELGGVVIPQGATLHLRYGAANRDEDSFDEPEELNLDRPNAGSHLAFGAGPHHCLGSELARQEMHCAFTILVDRLKGLRLDEERNDFEYAPHFVLRGLKHLYLKFDPGSKTGIEH